MICDRMPREIMKKPGITSKRWPTAPFTADLLDDLGYKFHDGVAFVGPAQNGLTLRGSTALLRDAGAGDFGEWIPATGHTTLTISSRVRYSCVLLEYLMIQPGTGASYSDFAFKVIDALTLAGPMDFHLYSGIGPVYKYGTTLFGGFDWYTFTNAYDIVSNKVKVMAVRITANTKRITLNFWDRNLSAMQTVVWDANGVGAGDVAYMWAIDQPAPGDGKAIIEFTTSDQDIPYGNPPERP